MKNILNPRWLFFVNTLPVIILLWLLQDNYNVIKSLLTEDVVQLWQLFEGILAGLGLGTLAYALFLIYRKRSVGPIYAIVALVTHIAYIYGYGYFLSDLIPSGVPNWMISEEFVISIFTFLMPTLAYALFALVVNLTRSPQKHKAWVNFLIMIAVPVMVYAFYNFLFPLFSDVIYSYPQKEHILIVSIIVCTLCFLFFLVRGIYIVASKKSGFWKRYEILWKIPVALLLPLLALALNQGLILPSSIHIGTDVFGDFGDRWFWILAVLNGVLICLPSFKNKTARLVLFLGRAITFTYSFYFFIVFLPYLPLSILAILVFGLGFLLLTPLLLFIVHANILHQDFCYLKKSYSNVMLWGLGCVAFLCIPIAITLNYAKDRSVLNEALEYVYNPDYKKEYNIDNRSVRHTLEFIDKQKGGNFMFTRRVPYLSSYFKWLVLDNMTLSDKKMNTLQYIFNNERLYPSYSTTNNLPIGRSGVRINHVDVQSRYDKEQEAWISWVNLDLQNESDWTKEYVTSIELPDGCWISDYYLYVGDRKEKGLLVEKKSAMWIYTQILDENKDPGLLYYLYGNHVVFRVFPFNAYEKRTTGIEFIHKEPVSLQFDDHVVALGDQETNTGNNTLVEVGAIAYVSATEKQNLRRVTRNAYFHFLVDASAGSNRSGEMVDKSRIVNHINQMMAQHPSLVQDAKVSLIDTYVQTFPLVGSDWERVYENQKSEGGFFLDKGIKTALVEAYEAGAYPVIVVLANSLYADYSSFDGLLLDESYSDYRFIYPESDSFYVTDAKNDSIYTYSLLNTKMAKTQGLFNPEKTEVLEYIHKGGRVSYLPDNGMPSLALGSKKFILDKDEVKEKNWLTGLQLTEEWKMQLLYPEPSQKSWLRLIGHSFRSGIMLPSTSYMVVENEAQKAALLRKQKEILSGHKSLDALEEEVMSMSEPDLIVMLLLLIVVALFYRKRVYNRG